METWIIVIQWIARLVLLVLFGLSIWSIAIIVSRRRVFASLETVDPFEEGRALIDQCDSGSLKAWSNKAGVRAGTINAALSAGSEPEAIDRAVRSYLTAERSKLECGLTELATLGSNAPFIGLFGTVLGIIQAFGALSDSQAASSGVMKGISEALFATAIGLFVAIPAVIAYNYFSRKLRVLLGECESLRDLYIARNAKSGR